MPDRRTSLLLAGLLALALGAAVAGIVVGAGNGEEGDPAPTGEAGRADLQQRVSFLAGIVPPPASAQEERPRTPAVPAGVAGVARRLSVERKVAQLFLLGFRGTDPGAEAFRRLRRLGLGGLALGPANFTDPEQLAALAGEARVVARAAGVVAPFVMAAQEGGDLNSFPGLPPAAAPADLASSAEAGKEALESGRALRKLGVNGVLGPVVDVGLATGSALGARVFSDDAEDVARYAAATTRAYRRARMFSSPAHFPGLGGADQSTEEGPASVGLDVEALRGRDLIPFRAAIRAGAPGLVLSHALYPLSDFTVPASLSRAVATGLLRDELRFKGVALTDDLADPAITALGTVPAAAVRALGAGADMLHVSGSPSDQQAAYVAVLRAVRSGRISRSRLDQAVGRILVAKRAYGVIRR